MKAVRTLGVSLGFLFSLGSFSFGGTFSGSCSSSSIFLKRSSSQSSSNLGRRFTMSSEFDRDIFSEVEDFSKFLTIISRLALLLLR
jgi:hypothetical protein